MQTASEIPFPHERSASAARAGVMESTVAETRNQSDLAWLVVFAVGLYVFLAVAYIGLRFSWNWRDIDVTQLTSISQVLFDQKTLFPQGSFYSFGYAYPSLNAFLAQLSGLSVDSLQQYVQPFLLVLLVPGAYAALRGLTDSAAGAALGTFLLFLQTEFIFEAARSSHAKLTWIFAFAMLFFLASSLKQRARASTMLVWVVLFYLAVYGLIASNSFFASQFLFGLACALVGWFVYSRWLRRDMAKNRWLDRLLYVVLACSILFYLYYFHIYRPALSQVYFLQTSADRLAGFLLDVEPSANPYGYVQSVWIRPWVYPLLMMLNWIVLLLSLIAWVRKTITFLKKKNIAQPQQILLWLLYMAFALLMAVSVVLDFAGVLSANLQVRIFPNFMIFAIAISADLMVEIFAGLRQRKPKFGAALMVAAALCFVYFSAASLLKITNEPLLNSFWSFQTSQERQSLSWVGNSLQDTTIWLGYSRRLKDFILNSQEWEANRIDSEAESGPLESRYLFISNPMELLTARTGKPLPQVWTELKVYDNGGAEVYYLRPKTPYQR